MLLITGMTRSGTTLLEKIIHNHINAAIASQPYPLLYSSIKKQYNLLNNNMSLYPLGNYFFDDSENLTDFYDFLLNYEIDGLFIDKIMEELRTYKGQLTPELFENDYIKDIHKNYFINIFKYLTNGIRNIYSNKDYIRCIGSKEVYCEEYIPFLLNNIDDFKAIIIIRDPRDIITSLNYGNYEKSTGKRRPILFDIRNWRKSVAFSIFLQNNLRFKVVKYENLVKNYNEEVTRIYDFLGLDLSDNLLDKGIKNQQGMKWMGNSSFGNKDTISNDSIGRFKEQLSPEIVKFIETSCYFEMKYLGFDFYQINDFDEKNINNFKEPFSIERDGFIEYYQDDIKLKKQEIERYNNVFKPMSKKENEKWFIFEEVKAEFEKLVD